MSHVYAPIPFSRSVFEGISIRVSLGLDVHKNRFVYFVIYPEVIMTVLGKVAVESDSKLETFRFW